MFVKVPAIVTEELWESVNAIILKQDMNRTQPLNRRTNIFTGFAFCMECNIKLKLPSKKL